MAHRRTKQSAQGYLVEKSLDLIPLTAGARAGTTFLHRVQAPPGRRASRVRFRNVATAETLYAIWPVGRHPVLRGWGEQGAPR